MTIVLVLAGAFAVFWVVLALLNRRPHRQLLSDRGDIAKFVTHLSTRCDDGSLLFIEVGDSEKFVQIATRGRPGRTQSLQFAFPDATWSRQHFLAVKEIVENWPMSYELVDANAGEVTRFLEVDLGNDIDTVARLLIAVLVAMGVSESAQLFARFEAKLVVPPAWRRSKKPA